MVGESLLSPDTAAWVAGDDLVALLASKEQEKKQQQHLDDLGGFFHSPGAEGEDGDDWLPTPVPDAYEDHQLAPSSSSSSEGESWGSGSGGGAASPVDQGLTLDHIFNSNMPVKDDDALLLKLDVSVFNVRQTSAAFTPQPQPRAAAAAAAAPAMVSPSTAHATTTTTTTTTTAPKRRSAIQKAAAEVAAEAGVEASGKRKQSNYRGPKNHPVRAV